MSVKCKPGQVINPRTGRPINVNGPTFKKLSVDVQSQLLKAAMPDVPAKSAKKPSSESKTVKYTPPQIAKTYCNDSLISYEITIDFLPEQSDLKQIRGLATTLKMSVRRNTKLQITTIKFREKTQTKVKKNRLDKMELKLKELGYKPNMIKMTDGSLFNPEFKKYVTQPKANSLPQKTKKYMVMLTTDGTMEDHDTACNFIRMRQLDLGSNSNGGGGRYFTNGHEFTFEQIKKNKFLSGKNKSFKIGKSKCTVSISPIN